MVQEINKQIKRKRHADLVKNYLFNIQFAQHEHISFRIWFDIKGMLIQAGVMPLLCKPNVERIESATFRTLLSYAAGNCQSELTGFDMNVCVCVCVFVCF